jgi:hypothetical protein
LLSRRRRDIAAILIHGTDESLVVKPSRVSSDLVAGVHLADGRLTE